MATFTAPTYTAAELEAKIAAAVAVILSAPVGSMQATQAGYSVATYRHQLNQLIQG